MENDKGQAKALQPQENTISNEHKLIAYWAVHRIKPKEIAQKLRIGIQTVQKVLRDPLVQQFIDFQRHKIYGEDPAFHLKECARLAVVVAEDIMTDKKVKAATRLVAAQDFMNREFGKAGIDDGTVQGTVREILKILQKPKEEINTKADIEDAQYVEMETEVKSIESKDQVPLKEADKIDDWLDKNLK